MAQISSDASNPTTYGSTAGSFNAVGADSSTGASSGALLSGTQAQEAGGAIGAFGSAIGDFMSISSDNAAASTYAQAAALAGQNIDITKTATNVQLEQSKRQLSMVLGQQTSATASNGFAIGKGTGVSLYKASAEQGALAQSLITSQGAVQENAYTAQQQADLSMEAQAKAKASGAMIGGIASTLQGVMDVAALA